MLIHMAYVSWFRFFLIISQGLCIKTCQDGEIQLVGRSKLPGTGDHDGGAIELCYGNTFGTVCGAGWSLINAIVVCRQLGYNGDVFAWDNSDRFGPGYGDIFFTNVACKGNESSLLSCSHGPYRQIDRCTHSNDAGVSCYSTCKDGNIRLLEAGESLGILQGTIQMCYNNSYGTICSDGWDYNDAHVLCNQSNIPALRAGSVAPFSDAHFGAGFGNILFSNFSCNGSEKTLLSCPHSFIYQTPGCTHDNDAGVHCYSISTNSYSIPIGIAAGTLFCIVLTVTAVLIWTCTCKRIKQRRIARAAIIHEPEFNKAARDSDNIASIKN